MVELALFATAKEALAELVRVDEVKDVRNRAEQMRLYGQQASDRTIIANATTIIMRAERRLGEILKNAFEEGQLGHGRRGRSNLEGSEERQDCDEGVSATERLTLAEVGISKALSRRSQKLAEADAEQFEAAVEQAREKIIAGSAIIVDPMKVLTTADKKARRAAREAELGRKQISLPEAKFGVILTDDEWEHATWSENGLDRAAANHYPVSSLEELKKRDVLSLAADDAVLWMWATVPHLDQAKELMAHRGFSYKSHCIWRKIYPGKRQGTGYWFRVDHELLLVGTRGNVPAPAPGAQWPSVIDAPVGEHSAKPDVFYELIETYFPTLPKIELNARRAREGWVRWGYEAPDQVADAAQIIEARTKVVSVAHTKETAEPILRARYATTPTAELAAELGVKISTVRTWAYRLKLTDHARIGRHMKDPANAAAEVQP